MQVLHCYMELQVCPKPVLAMQHRSGNGPHDENVIAAPYWDGSFPAMLKTYIENIYAIGIVTKYDNNGHPQGLCRAKKLYYVTTAGGRYNPRFSYDYLKYLVKNMFGIKDMELIYAEYLDVEGYDAEAILSETMKKIK